MISRLDMGEINLALDIAFEMPSRLGCARFGGIRWAELRSLTLIAAGWAAFTLGTALSAAWLATMFIDRSFESLLLAMAPGGTAEMVIITYALGADVAFVSGVQLCRVFLVLTGAPAIFRLLGAPRNHRPSS